MKQKRDISNISVEMDDDIIFITVEKYKLFLSYGKIGIDAYQLYSHLIFTARLQKTNSVYANNTYLKKGLCWGRDKLIQAKNLLHELGLIETVQKKDEKGKFNGNYIVVKTKTSSAGVPKKRSPVLRRKCLNEKVKCLNEEISDSIESQNSSANKNLIKSANKNLIKIDEITMFWNKLSNTRKHKDSSKIHKRINKLLNDLRKGNFYKYHFDENFLNKNKITKKDLKIKWTDENIKIILEKINLIYENKYWPYDKTKLTKDLDIIIYNKISQKSFFLMYMNNTPKLLNADKKQKPKNIIIYDKYKKLFAINDQKFVKMFNEFYTKVQIIFSDIEPCYRHRSFSSYLGSSRRQEVFFDIHIEWLKKQSQLFPGLMKGRPWQDFKNHIKKEYDFILEPNEGEKKEILRSYNESCRRIEAKKDEKNEYFF